MFVTMANWHLEQRSWGMGYRIIKGEFRLLYKVKRKVGSSPDGDSIWFKPYDNAHFDNLGGRGVSFNKGGFAQLRFEGIDCLELHYKGCNQDICLARLARNFTLGEVGFDNVEYVNADEMTVKSSNPDYVSGYIYTRGIDPFGRPVSFVMVGDIDKASGTDDWVDSQKIDNSINVKLIKAGLAYPSFYTSLPTDLRSHINSVCPNNIGIWGKDMTLNGIKVCCIDDLETSVIFPKLYRRLLDFWKTNPASLSGFDKWLRQKESRDDNLWIISKAELGNMHDVVCVCGNVIKMKFDPSDLVIVPR